MAEAQLNVGVMNPDNVVDALPEAQQIQQELENYVQQRREEFSGEYQQWIESVTEFEEQAESLSEGQRQQREQELAEREQELGQMEQQIRTQIQNRQNELLSPIMQRVEEAMQAVAQELELDFVINEITSSGDPIVYYASERGVDITERVIDRLTDN